MKSAVYYSREDIRVEQEQIPPLKQGEILIETKACGVCVADTMEWYLAPKSPLVLGHEAAGIVVQTGEGVTKVKPGDRVSVHHHVACLHCPDCLRGHYTLCDQFKASNYRPGGFAEYFVVSERHVGLDTLVLPDHVTLEAGTLVEPLACVIHAIRKADIAPRDSVAVIGVGTMGLLFVQSLAAYGIMNLFVYELNSWRQDMAREFGAPHVMSPLALSEEKRRIAAFGFPNGFDKVIIAAKDIRAIEFGIEITNKGGTTLFFATPDPGETIKINPSSLFFKEQKLVGSYSADHIDTRMALDLISAGKISADRIITHRFPLEQLSEAIKQTAGRGESLKCIVTMENGDD